MPVIFLPKDAEDEGDEDCKDSDGTQMSSFGFMSFAMAVVNMVINNANNVNNNNNNNNNNDNNNNNNLGNINIANSNNDVNNMNMVTAGRRRMLDKDTSHNYTKNTDLWKTSKQQSLLLTSNSKNTKHNLPLTIVNGNTAKDPEIKSSALGQVQTVSIGYIRSNHILTKNRTNSNWN